MTFDMFLRLLHFLGMAVWFGGSLSLASDARRTAALGKPHTDALEARLDRTLTIGLVAAVVTIGSGLGMIFARGGMKSVAPTIHIGLTLALLAVAVEAFAGRGAVRGIGAALANPDDARRALGKLGMVTGIGHALKLVTLILMVVR
jgi:hypothetical protein